MYYWICDKNLIADYIFSDESEGPKRKASNSNIIDYLKDKTDKEMEVKRGEMELRREEIKLERERFELEKEERKQRIN